MTSAIRRSISFTTPNPTVIVHDGSRSMRARATSLRAHRSVAPAAFLPQRSSSARLQPLADGVGAHARPALRALGGEGPRADDRYALSPLGIVRRLPARGLRRRLAT